MTTNIHVMPVDDYREHIDSLDCWCRPRRDNDEPQVIIHNSMDGREEYENGERGKH